MTPPAPAENGSSGPSCAIVGGGLGGLVAYTTLRHGGLEPDEIDVFGPDSDPAGTWRGRAAAIRQQRMRSESDGHCFATSFPGLAVQAALRQRTVRPLLESACDRYHPTVEEFLSHVEETRARSGWDESFHRGRIARVRAVEGGFSLDGRGVYPHVLLVPGHPGHAFPAELEGDARAVHAYEAHDYAVDVAVVGAGMAAATEWLNALAAGARVVSVRRREPARRSLNIERHYFTKRGLSGFHRTSSEERVALLRSFLAPSYPPGREWDEPLARAVTAGRFRVENALNGADQVICATGFRRGFVHDPMLADLASVHGLATVDAWIVLEPDSAVPALTDESRTLALAGAPGQWAHPGADTLVGMKYAARCFLSRVRRWRTR
jgi:cation diffusion facilitator CzcD-associated flavoprotein CzcO